MKKEPGEGGAWQRKGREGDGFQATCKEDIKSLVLFLPLSKSRSLCPGWAKGDSTVYQLLPPSQILIVEAEWGLKQLNGLE